MQLQLIYYVFPFRINYNDNVRPLYKTILAIKSITCFVEWWVYTELEKIYLLILYQMVKNTGLTILMSQLAMLS